MYHPLIREYFWMLEPIQTSGWQQNHENFTNELQFVKRSYGIFSSVLANEQLRRNSLSKIETVL